MNIRHSQANAILCKLRNIMEIRLLSLITSRSNILFSFGSKLGHSFFLSMPATLQTQHGEGKGKGGKEGRKEGKRTSKTHQDGGSNAKTNPNNIQNMIHPIRLRKSEKTLIQRARVRCFISRGTYLGLVVVVLDVWGRY